MRSIGRLVATLALALAIPAGATSCFAQTWPQRTVRVIVPLPPGTGMDISARLFTERLAGKWRQSVVVENVPGSDGILAVREFVNRRDNHTLLYSFAGLITINPLLHAKLPYDPTRDLVPIATTSDNALAIAASTSLNIESVAELEKLARTRSGKLNWAASPGIPYFAFAGFLKYAGLDMVYVSYRDFNPAFVDVGEGRIDIMVAGIAPMVPHSRSGKIRLLAVLNRERTPVAPEVPTASEIGYPSLAFWLRRRARRARWRNGGADLQREPADGRQPHHRRFCRRGGRRHGLDLGCDRDRVRIGHHRGPDQGLFPGSVEYRDLR